MLDQYRNVGGQLPSSISMLEFLKAYQRGFKILDDYDHHHLEVPVGQKDTYVLRYDECINLIHNTMFEIEEIYFLLKEMILLKVVFQRFIKVLERLIYIQL